MPNTYLTQTISSSTGKIFTLSMWIKKSANDSFNQLFHLSSDSNTHKYIDVATKSAYGLDVQLKNGSGGTFLRRRTNRLLRDFSGWFHILIRFDSTQGSAGDRLRIYINGEQETSIDADSTPDVPQDYVTDLNSNGGTLQIGRNPYNGGTGFFDGIISHYYLCDGYSYAPTVFGSTDSTTGEWKINTSPSITMGTNGFTILKDGNTITDQSSNSNDFTLGAGTLTKTEDCPSNVYCTFNPLIPQGLAYANGNLSATHDASSWKTAYGTIAMSGTGKYYFESKVSTLGSYQGVGIVDAEQISAGASKFGAVSRGYGYKNDGSKTNNNSDASYGATYTTGDIIGCALDLTNGAIYFSKNGAWQNSATTGEIAAGTTTNAAYTSISSSYVYLPAVQIYGSGTNQFNAGNGFFGTTAVSSVQNPSSGDTSAEFEYTPPTGFQPITTKGLNE